MSTIKHLLLPILLSLTATQSWAYKLWYDEPAVVWTDALPIGNGRLGAMVYGNPYVERLQLNEETIWAGQPNDNANPEALEAIPVIQNLIWQGEYLKAQEMATQKVMSRTNSGMPYQTFGDAYISMPGMTNYTDYRRELCLDSAKTVTYWTANGVRYKRETIASLSENVIMMRITADKQGSITLNANFCSPHADVIIRSEGESISLEGVTSSHEGLKGKVRFMGRMAMTVNGEKAQKVSQNGVISVTDADEAVLYITIATNFVNYHDITANEAERSKAALEKAMEHTYDTERERHIENYQRLMGRCTLWLGEDIYPNLPTDKRIVNFAENDDNHLVATYFTFGRYLLICCSQPGTQPANLQGIWNDKMFPSWDSKYTTNINLEMNYWPAEVTNLTELNEPLFRLIEEVSQTGARTAKTMYGKAGWVLHHNTDIWRVTGGIDRATSGMWMTGAAWLCHHLWEHYLFTMDIDFLQKYYPIMKDAALFLDNMLIPEPKHGWLVISPSVSPENVHPSKDGNVAISAGTAMDAQLIRELFDNVIAAAERLGVDDTLTQHYRERQKLLPPMQVGRWGQLQEWTEDWDDPEDVHRHLSHLYALYPGYAITDKTPELIKAARESLIHRGDPSTGWSMGWKVCLWARLLDGNHAYKLIHNQLTLTEDRFVAYGKNKKKGGTYRNLFDAHPPFQIDGNFGCTAGIAERLVQSHKGYIDILPALPDAWKAQGRVTGLMARGAIEICNLEWKAGKVTKLTVRSNAGGVIKIKYNGKLRTIKTVKGQEYQL